MPKKVVWNFGSPKDQKNQAEKEKAKKKEDDIKEEEDKA